MRLHVWLSALLVLVIGTESVSAQSALAEAARRAEEQRKNNAASSPVITDRDIAGTSMVEFGLEVLQIELTMPLVRRWGAAQSQMLRELVKNQAAARRLQASAGGTKDPKALERAYADEPIVVEAARQNGFTVHEFAMTQFAVAAAVVTLNGGHEDELRMFPTFSANVELLRKNAGEVTPILREAGILDAVQRAK